MRAGMLTDGWVKPASCGLKGKMDCRPAWVGNGPICNRRRV